MEHPNPAQSIKDAPASVNGALSHRASLAIEHFRRSLAQGKQWHLALLEAMGLWTLPEEVLDDRHFRYLVGGEAFDWLLLAERLCQEVDGLIPANEKEELLFSGRFPSSVSDDQLRDCLGPEKHRAYLNYWYGIVVEEALLLAVEEEVVKERQLLKGISLDRTEGEAFLRVYGDTRESLLSIFCHERRLASDESWTLGEGKEFTYWLFKRRLRDSDGARLASDTLKGLRKLNQLRGSA